MFNRWTSGSMVRRVDDVIVVVAGRNPERRGAQELIDATAGASAQTRALLWDLSRVRRFGVRALGALLAAKVLAQGRGIYIAAVCPPRAASR